MDDKTIKKEIMPFVPFTFESVKLFIENTYDKNSNCTPEIIIKISDIANAYMIPLPEAYKFCLTHFNKDEFPI